MDQPEEQPAMALMRLVNGFQLSQAIHVAARLGIADLLGDGPRSDEDLAAATGTHAPSLYRLLRALASVGVFREEGGRRFALTPLGACLRSDAPEPVGGWAALIGRPAYWQAWGHLLYSVRTGENAFRHLHGTDVWEYRAGNPAESAIFDQAMTDTSRRLAAAVLAAYDFGRFGCVVDVGGGQGAFLAAILSQHWETRGVLFDLPHVVAGAEDVARTAGVADRCDVVSGSFFEAVPEGGDAYILKAILHDWEDEPAAAILQSCRRAIGPHGTLIVVECEIGPPNEGAGVKFLDLNMLVAPGGQERTREEFAALFAAGGFRLTGAYPTAAGVSVIEGRLA